MSRSNFSSADLIVILYPSIKVWPSPSGFVQLNAILSQKASTSKVSFGGGRGFVRINFLGTFSSRHVSFPDRNTIKYFIIVTLQRPTWNLFLWVFIRRHRFSFYHLFRLSSLFVCVYICFSKKIFYHTKNYFWQIVKHTDIRNLRSTKLVYYCK